MKIPRSRTRGGSRLEQRQYLRTHLPRTAVAVYRRRVDVRSVHRGQGSGGISSSARVSSSPPPEYADLMFGDRTPEGLPRPPKLSSAMSSGGGGRTPPDGKVSGAGQRMQGVLPSLWRRG